MNERKFVEWDPVLPATNVTVTSPTKVLPDNVIPWDIYGSLSITRGTTWRNK